MIKIRKLNCGIDVVMDKTDFIQSLAIGIWVKTGSFNESYDNWGISHFIEHMMFKGTKNRDAKKIAEDVDLLGSQINAFTSKEATCYYIKSLGTNLKKSAEILVDMFTNSIFEEEEIDRERQVIFEEIKMIEDTPDDDAHDMISTLINTGNQFEKRIIGTYDSLSKINRADIIDYIKKQYTKDSIIVSIAGNFDEEEICNYLDEKLDIFNNSKEKESLIETLYTPRFKVKTKDIEQTHIFLGRPSISLSDPEYYNVQLVGNILGGTMSSRLFQNLRERKGLAYSVYSANSSTSKNGMFLIYAGVSHGKIEKAIEEMKVQLNLLKKDGITKEELIKGKEQMKSSLIFSLESISSKMFAIGRKYLLTGSIRADEEDQTIKEIDRITLDDTQKAIDLIGDIKNYSGVCLTKEELDLKNIVLN